MYVDKYVILEALPPSRDMWEVIKQDQSVTDIITQVLRAHYANEGLYDLIAPYFEADTVKEVCENIYSFLHENIVYTEESDESQTTAVPQGILSRGYGDCKHLASMAGGLLAAIKRRGGLRFSWYYCFASYKLWVRTPYHVFVIVQDGANEYWIDPVPGSAGRRPVWVDNRTVK